MLDVVVFIVSFAIQRLLELDLSIHNFYDVLAQSLCSKLKRSVAAPGAS